jgi:predicted nucleic acid-binding Zn ribbon protein
MTSLAKVFSSEVMKPRTSPSREHLPRALRAFLYYANARPSRRTWRRVVFGPFLGEHGLTVRTIRPDLPAYGVQSFEECQEILEDFQQFVARLLDDIRTRGRPERESAAEIFARAKLELKSLIWDSKTPRLNSVWQTESRGFREMLYGFLVHTAQDVSLAPLRKCTHCGKIFYRPTPRRLVYCSSSCRAIALSLRYQKRHRSKYLAYHRALVRRLRKANPQRQPSRRRTASATTDAPAATS